MPPAAVSRCAKDMEQAAHGRFRIPAMIAWRSTWMCLMVAVVSVQKIRAQDGNLPAWLHPLHHAEAIPDYVAGIASLGLQLIRIPAPPPETAEGWLLLHHNARPPDYLANAHPIDVGSILIPPPPTGEAPAVVRGLYVNGWVFSASRFYDLLELADTTEINAFVIDVKDATGYITYRSSVSIAEQIGANRLLRIRDPRPRLELLDSHGIHAIARIVVARDPLLATNKPEWAIRDSITGGLWRDGLGDAWVDAYNDSVWVYAADLAAEAVLMGFKEIQFDYIRFPDEPPQRLNRTVYPARQGRESRRSAIRRNTGLLRERVTALGVPFTLDVFGLTASARGDLGIGQVWEDLSTAADVILPMVYPSHYRRGAFGIDNPNRSPYETVQRAVQDAVIRSTTMERPARIRPFLQAFTIYRVRYGGPEIRAQIQAVEDAGLTDWVLWNARGVYPADALRPATQRAKPLDERTAAPTDRSP